MILSHQELIQLNETMSEISAVPTLGIEGKDIISGPDRALMIKKINPNSSFKSLQPGDLLMEINDYFYSGDYTWTKYNQQNEIVMVTDNLAQALINDKVVELEINYYETKKDRLAELETFGEGYIDSIGRQIKVPFTALYQIEQTRAVQNYLNRSLYRKELLSEIRSELFAQDEAISAVFESVKVFMAGLKDEDKPIGAYLLTGPTGVGKTELAEVFHKKLNFDLVRINMSEFQHDHEIAKLIGAPPGFVGHSGKTILEEKIGSDQKRCILLLDEMDKAHSKVQNTFLQIMDRAELVQGNGNRIDFSNCLILYTANLGVVTNRSISLSPQTDLLSVDETVIKKHLTPEFLGRLSGVVKFQALTEPVCEQILEKFLTKLRNELFLDQGLELELDATSKRWLLGRGFDPHYGARPLKNLLNRSLKPQIADIVLGREDQGPIKVKALVESDRLVLARVNE